MNRIVVRTRKSCINSPLRVSLRSSTHRRTFTLTSRYYNPKYTQVFDVSPDVEGRTNNALDKLSVFREEKFERAGNAKSTGLDLCIQPFEDVSAFLDLPTSPKLASYWCEFLKQTELLGHDSQRKVALSLRPKWTFTLGKQSRANCDSDTVFRYFTLDIYVPFTPLPAQFHIKKIRLEGDVDPQQEDVSVPQLVLHIRRNVVEAVASDRTGLSTDQHCERIVHTAALTMSSMWKKSSVHRAHAQVRSNLTNLTRGTMDCEVDFGIEKPNHAHVQMLKEKKISRAFIALGSNLGNKFEMIERACEEMDKAGLYVVRTSGLWETEAMYVKDQDHFLNGVCEVHVEATSARKVLEKLQHIEKRMGRVKIEDKGPRCIDLDILLWGNEVVIDSSIPLYIPHPSMLEREFVLRPLCELIPHEALPPSTQLGTFATHLQNLIQSTGSGVSSSEKGQGREQQALQMSTQVLLCPTLAPLAPLLPRRKTHVMSILNLTPDSFSDGGQHSSSDLESLRNTISTHLAAGATIIDVGGQSSRPGAESIGSEEEISRILPAINVIKRKNESITSRSSPSTLSSGTDKDANSTAAISVDTYRADVATAAVQAGADIINDISGGTLDPMMLQTIAHLGCTYILMHMRGTPETMTESVFTEYEGDLIQVIGTEMVERLAVAERAGIRRWRIILDPGIGFAKTGAQNLELLRRFGELRNFEGLKGMPWVVGVSRKKFIGTITGVQDPQDRIWGTAAAVTAAVQGGADIVRVHDVTAMGQITKMADAIWRL